MRCEEGVAGLSPRTVSAANKRRSRYSSRVEGILKLVGVALALFAMVLFLDAFDVFTSNHPLVTWHMQWGANTAWALRGGMLALGLVLIFLTPTGDRRGA